MAGLAQRVPRRALWYVAALVPFLTAVVRALVNDWFPIGDGAQLYIRATDVLTRHHPWIGSGSSASVSLGFQVNNAGPTYFDLVAPFARTLPSGPGNVIGVATINAACLVLAAVAARRIGGAVYEAWVLAAGAVLAWTMGSELLFDMFQAHALLLPFLATLVLLTGVAVGQIWVWPWLALLLTTIAQTHISYAYVLMVVVVAAIAIGWRGLADGARDRSRRRVWWWTLGVLAVTWFQPVYEQLFGPGEGNLSRLARAARADSPTLGLGNAAKLLGAYVALPPWAGRQGFADTYQASGLVDGAVVLNGMPPGWVAALALLVLTGLLVGAWWWARRHGQRVLAAVALFAAVALAGSVVALSRLTVTELGLAPHHTRWAFPIALLAYLALAWAATRLVVSTGSTTVATLVPALVLLVASVANVAEFAHAEGPTADRWSMPALRQAFTALDRVIDDGELPEPVLYDLTDERVYTPYTSAIQAHLRDRGIEFRVVPEFNVRQLGERRRADGTEPATIVHTEAWRAFAPPAGCLVARTSGRAPADDAAMEARGTELADRLAEALTTGRLVVDIPESAPATDRTIAAALGVGDTSRLAEITFDGRLAAWVDFGWAAFADPDDGLAVEFARQAPDLTIWLDHLLAVVITRGGTCAAAP